MVTAYVDLDQNEETKKDASYAVPRYVTRRIRREALKTVATSNTPGKDKTLEHNYWENRCYQEDIEEKGNSFEKVKPKKSKSQSRGN